MRLLDGLREVADRHDGYVVDLWGVIHDGVTPYPGAIACLQALRARGARIVLLSNAPRRAAVAIEGLRRLGVADELYDAVVTSGEATWLALRDRPDGWFAALGTRVFHLGPPRDASVFAGLPIVPVESPGEAQFVLNTGPDDARSPTDPAAFDDVLASCRAAGLPMLCANPDLVVMREGVRVICAGTLAERYAGLGGEVRSIGKPGAAIYGGVMDHLGIDADRVLAIGDSLHTDIAGAAAAGLTALWILGGIHSHASVAEAAAEAAGLGLLPAYALPRLVWG